MPCEAAQGAQGAQGAPGAQGGGTPPAWTAQLTENLRGHEAITRHQTISDLAGDYVSVNGKASELEGKLKDAIFMPAENATEEERAAFYSRLGRPETPDQYDFQKPELPEGMPYNEEKEKAFREFAHKNGLSKTQAKALYDLYHKDAVESWNTIQGTAKRIHDEAVTALQTEWGDKYQGNTELAVRAAEQFGGPEFKKFLEESRLGDNPVIVKVFHAIGKALGDDKFVPGTSGRSEKSAAETFYPNMK